MIEVWRNIVGYEGLYQVSNFGRVRSLPRNTTSGRILKPAVCSGYLQVVLCKDGKKKILLVHRLVAQAFLENPDNLPQVNHKDENPLNNHVDNLEWCTRKYNINFGTGRERHAKMLRGKYNTKASKPVIQKTKDGEFVREWPSAAEVQRQMGWSIQSISNACLDRVKSSHGYVWRYATDA